VPTTALHARQREILEGVWVNADGAPRAERESRSPASDGLSSSVRPSSGQADTPHRVAGKGGEVALSLRLPATKFFKNNHQFTLALRFASFKDLEAVDIRRICDENPRGHVGE